MSNSYSIHTAEQILPCSPEDIARAQTLLEQPDEEEEPERAALWVDSDYPYHGFKVTSTGAQGDGLFLFADENGTSGDLPPDFLQFLGSLIAKAGLPYLGMGFAATCSKMLVGSHGGGEWRIYPDGSIVWPTAHYRPVDIQWPEVAA